MLLWNTEQILHQRSLAAGSPSLMGNSRFLQLMRYASSSVHFADGFSRFRVGSLMDYSICHAEIPPVWLEPEQPGDDEPFCADPRDGRHLWDDASVALCRHVFLLLLLAHRGSLELLHQLPPLVVSPIPSLPSNGRHQVETSFKVDYVVKCHLKGGAQNLVWSSWLCCRATGGGDAETGPRAV